jgi:hypothetical protein
MANFSEEKINHIWEKGSVVAGYNKDIYRKDTCGAWIQKDKYGIEKSMGWDIDHKKPKAEYGTDHLNNLQPMQCYHNRVVKSDNYPWTKDQHWRRFNQLNKK